MVSPLPHADCLSQSAQEAYVAFLPIQPVVQRWGPLLPGGEPRYRPDGAGSSPFFSPRVSIPSRPVCLIGDHHGKEGAMKYMLLCDQGDSPTRRAPAAWAALSAAAETAV